MNDEPPGSASTTRDEHNDIGPLLPPSTVPQGTRERRIRDRLLFNKKRELFLKDFGRDIDIVIYAELAAIYYMDCSFIRFLIRASVQFTFLTPKPHFLPEPPQNRPYIGVILGSNLLCLFFHLLNARPAASEATRGYLHGGLAMDFIGQKGPTSKLHLSLLDILVFLLQLVALGAHVTRVKVKKQATAPAPVPAASATAAVPETQPVQDLDHEERGLHRSDLNPVGIELQNLNSSGRRTSLGLAQSSAIGEEEAGDDEREALLASNTRPPSDSHIFDAFNSGEIMIADLDMANLVYTQMRDFQSAPRESITTPTGPGLSERLARGGLGFRFRIGDRIVGI